MHRTGSFHRTPPAGLAVQIPGATLMQLNHAGHLLPQLHARQLVDAVMLALAAAAANINLGFDWRGSVRLDPASSG